MSVAATRIRWSDNDRYFGPFTVALSDYRATAIVLGSGDGDEHPGCRLRLSAFGATLIIALPPIIKPERTRVVPSSWDEKTIARLGRNWYYDYKTREYGASVFEGHLCVFLGRQTHDSSTEQTWGCFLPWTQWRFVRHSLYGLNGEHIWTEPTAPKTALKGEAFAHSRRAHWDATYEAQQRCPSATFAFKDFDGEELTATTKIEEREWLFGTGWCSWLSLFRKPKVRRSLDINFSEATGRRKGSWKGGTMGTSIDMLPSVGRLGEGAELHESAFRRYCAAHDMTFIGPAPQSSQQAAAAAANTKAINSVLEGGKT